MNQKGFINLIVIVTLLLLLGAIVYNRHKTTDETAMRVCPEEWRQEASPNVFEDRRAPLQYYVHEGKRRELDIFDVDWVNKNCGLWLEKDRYLVE